MRARSGGRIVNVANYVGRVYIPFVSTYVATKHAVEGWSDCLRAEVAPFGNIKVVIIEPGAKKPWAWMRTHHRTPSIIKPFVDAPVR